MGFGGLGMWEILLIFLVALLLFGAKRLPEIGSSLGKGIREFKSSVREIEGEFKNSESRRLDEGSPDVETQERDKAPSEQDKGEPRKLSSR
jgi:sec-independent protein translocase protein TatA